MIFVLEDSEDRIKAFTRAFLPGKFFLAKSMKEAIPIIEKSWEQIDELYLDFDLGDLDNETGLEFVKFLTEFMKDRPHDNWKIIIHSCNPWGAKSMAYELKDKGFDCEVTPYYSLKGVAPTTPNFNRFDIDDYPDFW